VYKANALRGEGIKPGS